MSRILVINDDEAIRVTIGKILELDLHGVVLVANAKRAIHTLQHQNFDLVICKTSEKDDMDAVSQTARRRHGKHLGHLWG
jgi:CheY-like chemotaxis protein